MLWVKELVFSAGIRADHALGSTWLGNGAFPVRKTWPVALVHSQNGWGIVANTTAGKLHVDLIYWYYRY